MNISTKVHTSKVCWHIASQEQAERPLGAVHGAGRQQGAEEAPRRKHQQLPGAVAVEAAPRRALRRVNKASQVCRIRGCEWIIVNPLSCVRLFSYT